MRRSRRTNSFDVQRLERCALFDTNVSIEISFVNLGNSNRISSASFVRHQCRPLIANARAISPFRRPVQRLTDSDILWVRIYEGGVQAFLNIQGVQTAYHKFENLEGIGPSNVRDPYKLV
jgi:hypothetical protein